MVRPMNTVSIAGWAGLAGALLVGMGEYCLQYTPNGGYESGYTFFADVSKTRLTIGHYLSVLAAPLYLLGYWHLSRLISKDKSVSSSLFFCIGGYAFVIGTAWISQRVFLALTAHEIVAGQDLLALQESFAAHNEPLVNVLRIAMLIVSAIWVFNILKGRSYYPKWMAIFSPIALLALMFASYWLLPKIGNHLLPVAMNATHVIVFSLSLWTTRHLEISR